MVVHCRFMAMPALSHAPTAVLAAATDLLQGLDDLCAALIRHCIVSEQLLDGAQHNANEPRVLALTHQQERPQDLLQY